MKYLIWIGASLIIAMILGAVIGTFLATAVNKFSKKDRTETDPENIGVFLWSSVIVFVISLIVGGRFVLSPEQIEKVIYVGSMVIGGAAILLILNILGRIFEVAFSIIKVLIKVAIAIFIIAFLASLMFGI